MARQAKYRIMIPTHDNLGNQLRDLATATHHHLFHNAGIEGSYVDPGKKGNWRNDPQETFDHLVTYADDTPETDSHIKAAAANVGQLANQWSVAVAKDSKDGPALWLIDNPNYREGEPAHPSARANSFEPLPTSADTPSESAQETAGGSLMSYVASVLNVEREALRRP